MKIFAVLLYAVACFVIYLSHANQTLLVQPLSRIYRYLALLIGVIAFGLLSCDLPWLVAIFMSVVTAIVVWTFAPFISALKRYSAHESEKSSKNSS